MRLLKKEQNIASEEKKLKNGKNQLTDRQVN